jgi:hypothetical protein
LARMIVGIGLWDGMSGFITERRDLARLHEEIMTRRAYSINLKSSFVLGYVKFIASDSLLDLTRSGTEVPHLGIVCHPARFGTLRPFFYIFIFHCNGDFSCSQYASHS